MSKTIKQVSIIDRPRVVRKQPVSTKKSQAVSSLDAPTFTGIISNSSAIPTVVPDKSVVLKDAKKLRHRGSIIQEFSLNTSTHGLPGIARSESPHNRIFWTITFLCFTTIMIYFVTKAIVTYFNYPTQIDLEISREWPQYFPAVSICNGAAFRMDRFIDPFFNYTNTRNITNSFNASTIPPYLTAYIGDFITDKFNANETLDAYFFSLSSMLYTCSFNGVPCTAADFIPFTSSVYGLCFTFNAKIKNSSTNSIRYGNQNGGGGVLDLELYVHSHQYIPFYWNGFGAVAFVHDNTQLPLIETSGLLLRPGERHKLGYKKKTNTLLPAPYTSCTNKVPLSMNIMLDTYYDRADYGYSQTICFQLCEQVYSYEYCGCVSPVLWNARFIVLPNTKEPILAPVCTNISTDPCFKRAVDVLLSSSSLMKKYCSDCSQECSITDFIIQKSSLATPLEWQLDGIKAFVENSTVPLPSNWSTTSREYIEKNYLAVSVVRETTIAESNMQTAQFTIVDVLSNVGGQTGLWIGISLMSIMEFIEMLYRLIRYQYHEIRLRLPRLQRIRPQ